MTSNNLHNHAQNYGEHGLKIIPSNPETKRPHIPEWHNKATNNPNQINEWFTHPNNTGISLVMGQQPNGLNLFALDIDTKNGDGHTELHQLQNQYGPLPKTWETRTPSGGTHLIYTAPNHVTIRNQQGHGNRLAPNIDVRGHHGQIVAPPTITPTGQYTWTNHPDTTPIAPAPQWLIDLLTTPPTPKPVTPPPPPRTPNTQPTPNPTPADLLRQQWDWTRQLQQHGWQHVRTQGDDTYWSRPGKTDGGHSAVLHNNGPLVIFTTEIPQNLHGQPTADGTGITVTPLQWYAAHHHNGDIKAASTAIRNQHQPDTPAIIPFTLHPQPGTAAPANVDPETGEIIRPNPDNADTELVPDEITPLVNWNTFWTEDHHTAEWLAEPIIAAGRSTAIFAKGGAGKSLLTLHLATAIATGTPALGQQHHTTPLPVLYLDYEMTPADLAERLEAAGWGPKTNLDNLHYALLPTLPPLDTPAGGQAVIRLAQHCNAALVIIDTYSRAVEGDENEAGTVRALYRNSLMHLKAEGRAVLRIDHAGKDVDKGQRGSSAKNDDVDVVWRLTPTGTDGALQLKNLKRRMGWVPERVDLQRHDHPTLTYTRAPEQWPAGTADTAKHLDAHHAPLDITVQNAVRLCRETGNPTRTATVAAALKHRRNVAELAHIRPRTPPSGDTTATVADLF